MLFYASLTIASYVLGFLFFDEKSTIEKIIALILGLLGLGVIYTLEFESNLFAVIVASLAGLCGGIEVVFTKKISEKYSGYKYLHFYLR